MKKRNVTNLPASIHDRLLKIAKERGAEFQDLLLYYALERWLYRMTQSVICHWGVGSQLTTTRMRLAYSSGRQKPEESGARPDH